MTNVTAHSFEEGADFDEYFRLLKPRVMSLVVFTAGVGLFVAPHSMNLIVAFASVLFIAVGAGASGALNMWWDSDIDAKMKRTQNRPIPKGQVRPSEALTLGLWLSFISVMMMALTANLFASALLAFTIFFYAVIYTMWLKRATPQNIVIGGAAGAFPPMIGWVAATGSISIEPVLMFLVIFMWTPPHFWALALFVKDDYGVAEVPMLTETHGPKTTRVQILIYAALLTPITLALTFTSIGSASYFGVAFVLSAHFLMESYRVFKRSQEEAHADNFKIERGLFKLSLSYLFVLFSMLLIGPWIDQFFNLIIVRFT